MFKFINISNSDLKKIFQIRNQNQDPEKLLNMAGGEAQELTFPHETFSLALSELKNKKNPKAEATGIRVIEAAKDNFNFIYDLNKIKGGSQPQMFQDLKFLNGYQTAFNNILGNETESENYVVRTLKVPALNVEALWLHKPGESTQDKYLPVRAINLFETNKLYSKKEFFAVLKEAAENYDIDNDMKGG